MNARRTLISLPEVLFEFIPSGRYVKVIAVDPITRMEVSIVGDPKAGKEAMKRVAKRKLEYVITKQLTAKGSADNSGDLY